MIIIIYFHDSMSLHIYFIIEKINVLLLNFFDIDNFFCEDVIIYFHDYMLRQIFLFDLYKYSFRVRLLRCVEEMGGRMKYTELCQVRT